MGNKQKIHFFDKESKTTMIIRYISRVKVLRYSENIMEVIIKITKVQKNVGKTKVEIIECSYNKLKIFLISRLEKNVVKLKTKILKNYKT